jgi:hypothetical protein
MTNFRSTRRKEIYFVVWARGINEEMLATITVKLKWRDGGVVEEPRILRTDGEEQSVSELWIMGSGQACAVRLSGHAAQCICEAARLQHTSHSHSAREMRPHLSECVHWYQERYECCIVHEVYVYILVVTDMDTISETVYPFGISTCGPEEMDYEFTDWLVD